MLAHRVHENPYEQMVGSTERLKELPAQSFDVVVCHNVLEYVTDREEVLCELCRAQEIPAFRDIAFFHHIILRNNTAGA